MKTVNHNDIPSLVSFIPKMSETYFQRTLTRRAQHWTRRAQHRLMNLK